MAGSLNKVQLIGHVGRDPEVRRTGNGDPVVSFSMATTESWRDKATGERKDKTEWHNITIWNEGIGKIAEQYVRKGSKIMIEGQLQSRTYTDKENVERKVWDIVVPRFGGLLLLLSSKDDDDDGGGRQEGRSSFGSNRPSEGGSASFGGGRTTGQVIEDDIPLLPEFR